MGKLVDFRGAPLGRDALRAAVYVAFHCPHCNLPVFIHYTFGSKTMPSLFLPLCNCPEPPGLEVEIPRDENLGLEREALMMLVSATRQLLAQAAFVIGTSPEDGGEPRSPATVSRRLTERTDDVREACPVHSHQVPVPEDPTSHILDARGDGSLLPD